MTAEQVLWEAQKERMRTNTVGTAWLPIEKQVGGSHYQLPIQPIDYIVKNNLGYREGNVIKYVTRHKDKNGAEDIKKAIHYLEMILKDYNDRV
jgi:hypothetical protein